MGTRLSRRKGHSTPHFSGPCLLWPNGRPSQQLLNSCLSSLLFSPTQLHKILTSSELIERLTNWTTNWTNWSILIYWTRLTEAYCTNGSSLTTITSMAERATKTHFTPPTPTRQNCFIGSGWRRWCEHNSRLLRTFATENFEITCLIFFSFVGSASAVWTEFANSRNWSPLVIAYKHSGSLISLNLFVAYN